MLVLKTYLDRDFSILLLLLSIISIIEFESNDKSLSKTVHRLQAAVDV